LFVRCLKETEWWRVNNQNAPRVGSSLKKLLGCGVSIWYTLFVGWIEYSINTPNTFFKIVLLIILVGGK
jgi:hypothetical protein